MENKMIDGVKVAVNYAQASDAPVSDDEIKAYIKRAYDKYPHGQLESLTLDVDGEDVGIHYGLAPVKFDRIRRITGYLVGTLDRFNDAKRAEEEQFAQDTLAQAGIGSGIVTSQMLVDNINGMDAELTAQRAAADREWTYGHIVVDEAQELTAMDWRMLIRRCPSRSFTIVGDVAQTSALGGTRSWRRMMDPLFGPHNWQLNELTINYRNPKEVSQLACDFAATEGLYISTVNAVRGVPDSVKRLTLADDSLIADAVAQQTVDLVRAFVSSDGTGRVAIIAPDDMVKPLRRRVYEQLRETLTAKEFDRLDAQSSWDEQVTVCSTQMVKGLEYDAVMVVQPGSIEENAPSRIVAAADLYVAMTRPTQRLLIVRTNADEKLLKL